MRIVVQLVFVAVAFAMFAVFRVAFHWSVTDSLLAAILTEISLISAQIAEPSM